VTAWLFKLCDREYERRAGWGRVAEGSFFLVNLRVSL